MPNRFGLSLVSGPSSEPVSLLQAKRHLRVDFMEDDDLILALITAARELVENIINRAIYTQSWKMTLDSFPYPTSFETFAPEQRNPYSYILDRYSITLPLGGVTGITSISYQTSTGTVSVDPSQFRVDTNSKPTRITPWDAFTWPVLDVTSPGCIEILFTAGSYGDGADADTCPMSLKQAMLLLIGHLYTNREAASETPSIILPFAVEALLAPYKVFTSC
ncbi:head-tail connector protein [Terriglobus roseus]|uniref:Phage gp6-like head-tail connector protein n=1 Tax=Terriglobus roseus TaxID=392734 RepID=A0A1H4J3B3_9BACT|nr:head-tail connector protein [Terriglobus roseus]SEB40733.1 phage conserved hypothetical protein, phiE125 gp8 family [Terriglobus roseus]